MKVHQEGVVKLLQDVPLGHRVLHLPVLENVLLAEHFHRKNLPSCLVSDLHDLPKAPFSNKFDEIKVLHAHLGGFRRGVQLDQRLVEHLDPLLPRFAVLSADVVRASRRLDLENMLLLAVLDSTDVPGVLEGDGPLGLGVLVALRVDEDAVHKHKVALLPGLPGAPLLGEVPPVGGGGHTAGPAAGFGNINRAFA